MFFFGGADFFSAKRLFFRVARDVSGVRSNPLWARVVIKLKTSFQALSHSSSHERAKALTSPPPDFLFSSIPPKPPYKATIPPNRDERGKPAIGAGVSCLTPCKRGVAERSLETAQSQAMSLVEGRSRQIIDVGYRGYSHSMVAGGFDEIS